MFAGRLYGRYNDAQIFAALLVDIRLNAHTRNFVTLKTVSRELVFMRMHDEMFSGVAYTNYAWQVCYLIGRTLETGIQNLFMFFVCWHKMDV